MKAKLFKKVKNLFNKASHKTDEKTYDIQLVVPGLKKEDLKIELIGHVLHVFSKNQNS